MKIRIQVSHLVRSSIRLWRIYRMLHIFTSLKAWC